jgi:hypothetical protein
MSAASRRVYVELRRDWIGMLPELSGSDDWMAFRANGSVASAMHCREHFFAASTFDI